MLTHTPEQSSGPGAGWMVRPYQPGHLRDIPSYCLDEYEEEVPSAGSQVEDEESGDGLGPGQLQTDPEEQQQRCKSSQTQHRGLRRERNHGHQLTHTGLGNNEPMGGGCVSSPNFLDEVPESSLLLAARM